MSSESVCQVARSWVDVSSFHTRLVMMNFTASVRNILDTPSCILPNSTYLSNMPSLPPPPKTEAGQRRVFQNSVTCLLNYLLLHFRMRPASWSSGQNFWLLIMRSRVRFPVLPWGFFLEGEDSHCDHGLGSLVELRFKAPLVLHIHTSPSTSSGQRNCVSWASQPQKSVTLRPQPGGETTKSIRDMCWHWKEKKSECCNFKLIFWPSF
jgi:hypothetical protein